MSTENTSTSNMIIKKYENLNNEKLKYENLNNENQKYENHKYEKSIDYNDLLHCVVRYTQPNG